MNIKDKILGKRISGIFNALNILLGMFCIIYYLSLIHIYQRCAQEHIVHENTYRSMDDTELREMLSHQYKNSTFEDWCKAFCKRKYNSDFSKEMTRSVGEYLKQFE